MVWGYRKLRISYGVNVEEFTVWDEQHSTIALCTAAQKILNFRLSYYHVKNL